MSLDPTARLSNVKDSLKKYFSDNLEGVEQLNISFDPTLNTPPVSQGQIVVESWIQIRELGKSMGSSSSMQMDFICCTRKDSEGFKLAQLRDKVMGYLTDSNQTDGMRRITFYQSRATGAWTVIGGIIITNIKESGTLPAADNTKQIILTVTFKWGARI